MTQPFSPFDMTDLLNMARTVYGEARGQPYDGQIAVAWVIRNRASRPRRFGQTISEVVHWPWQFSCWNANDPNLDKIKNATVPKIVLQVGICSLVLSGYMPDPTQGADHYHTVAKPAGVKSWPPRWARDPDRMKMLVTIGDHIFYKEAEG